MTIKVSVGEAIDKLSILYIKSKKITDITKLENVVKEYEYLHFEIYKNHKEILEGVHYLELVSTNQKLWEIEDILRAMESDFDFDDNFIAAARQVYKLNDYRAELKKRINQGYHSEFIEEKSYKKY